LPIKKAYGYVNRVKEDTTQVLVFRHSVTEAGIQIPKGTVNTNETTYDAVIREMKEETGLKDFNVEKLLAKDLWENDDGVLHNRFFYKINVSDTLDEWDYNPAGGGDEAVLIFNYFWISSKDDIELSRVHGDYLHLNFN